MLSDWQRIYLRTALVSDFVRLGVVISVDRMGRNISAALHPLNGMPKNTPANREKYRGVLWVGLQTMAIRSRFQPESKLFPGKPGSCKTSGGFLAIFGGFQRFKKLRKAVIFFESGGIFGGKGRNPPIRESVETPAWLQSLQKSRAPIGQRFCVSLSSAAPATLRESA